MEFYGEKYRERFRADFFNENLSKKHQTLKNFFRQGCQNWNLSVRGNFLFSFRKKTIYFCLSSDSDRWIFESWGKHLCQVYQKNFLPVQMIMNWGAKIEEAAVETAITCQRELFSIYNFLIRGLVHAAGAIFWRFKIYPVREYICTKTAITTWWEANILRPQIFCNQDLQQRKFLSFPKKVSELTFYENHSFIVTDQTHPYKKSVTVLAMIPMPTIMWRKGSRTP